VLRPWCTVFVIISTVVTWWIKDEEGGLQCGSGLACCGAEPLVLEMGAPGGQGNEGGAEDGGSGGGREGMGGGEDVAAGRKV